MASSLSFLLYLRISFFRFRINLRSLFKGFVLANADGTIDILGRTVTILAFCGLLFPNICFFLIEFTLNMIPLSFTNFSTV